MLKSSLDARKLRISQAPWLDAAVDDIMDASSDLSTFFDDCGPALVEGREAFAPLATLFCFLRGASSIPEDEVMETLEHTAISSLPASVRLDVIKRAALAANNASPRAVAAYLDWLDLFDAAGRTEAARRLGHRLVRTESGRLMALLEGSPGERDFASQVIDLATNEGPCRGGDGRCRVRPNASRHRRDLLANSRFVSNYPSVGAILSLAGQLDDAGREVVVSALMRSGRSDVDILRLRRIDGHAFWNTLQDLARGDEFSEGPRASNIVRYLCTDASLITADLSAGLVKSGPMLEAICHATWPDRS